MKLVILILSILYSTTGWSQDTASQAEQYFKSDNKAKVYFNDSSFVRARLHSFNDTTLSLVFEDYTERSFAISGIRTIRVNRQAFWVGAIGGGFLGYYGGYIYGYISYKGSDSNESNRSHGILTGIKSIAPAAFLGGIIGAFTIKKKFVIAGKKERVVKMYAVM